ncbi:hypothetical protein SETIT_8G022500v2 [Setaria italica]|uniref:DUF4220 domain-containing protein n=1 Tax=Setaria italica TaxID=4555 RepID=A0A368S3M4_SETIT|nr:hypothetical protein SETIT_8G022500v2 [Setaria italica]
MFLLHVLGSVRRRSSNTVLHSIVTGAYTLSYPLVSYTIGLMYNSDWYYKDFAVWAVLLLLLLGSTEILTNQVVPYRYPFYGIVLVVILKGYVRIASMRMVSKSYLGMEVKVIAEYMQYVDNKVVAFDPVTMEGYRYIVAGEKHSNTTWYKKPDDSKVTTVEQIWQCEGNLLVIGDRGKVLKDSCLSMALSKMLNRRFAGFKLSEAELKKTHDFVFKGLLAGDKPHQRAFRVIEEELAFVHDYLYYTRYSYFYQKGRYIALCLPITMLALCSWLACVLVVHYQRTSLLLGVIACISSGWFKLALMRSYVTTPLLRRSRTLEMIIGLLLRFKAFQPWKCRLGQYCLLQELGRKSRARNCLHYATLCLVDKASKERKKSEKLSEDVKKAIVDSLLASNGHLTNGVTSLRRNGVHDDLKWVCDATATYGAVARTIVVWHIATTLCEKKLDKQAKEEYAVKRASTLSKYCMHLLAFAPNLLPDQSSISESILDHSIDEVRKLLKEAMYKKIEGRWKVLSDFWAEMMLYVSPSDDAREHLEVLAKGGEFITHLWALLTHAGVLKREPKDVV